MDFENKQLQVTRSIVNRVVGPCKTESSQKPVPAHDNLLEILREWHKRSRYQLPENWVFEGPQTRGRQPYLAAADHATTDGPGCKKIKDDETDRLAHVSTYVFHAASVHRCGTENHVRTVTSLDHPRDARHVYPGSHDSRGRALVPAEDAGIARLDLDLRESCAYFAILCFFVPMQN